jgi:hypothetical protein
VIARVALGIGPQRIDECACWDFCCAEGDHCLQQLQLFAQGAPRE